jgi:hypothetical protein
MLEVAPPERSPHSIRRRSELVMKRRERAGLGHFAQPSAHAARPSSALADAGEGGLAPGRVLSIRQ